MSAISALKRLHDQLIEDSYLTGDKTSRDGIRGVSSMPSKSESRPSSGFPIKDHHAYVLASQLESDIIRLVRTYRSIYQYHGRKPGVCQHEWLQICPKCGTRRATEASKHDTRVITYQAKRGKHNGNE